VLSPTDGLDALRGVQRGCESQWPREPSRPRDPRDPVSHRRVRCAEQVLGGVSRRPVRFRHHRLRQDARILSGLSRAADRRALGRGRSGRSRGRRGSKPPGSQESRPRDSSTAGSVHGTSAGLAGPSSPGGGHQGDREGVSGRSLAGLPATAGPCYIGRVPDPGNPPNGPPVSDVQHWDAVYTSKSPEAVSWFRPHLDRSLAFVEAARPERDAPIIDVGGGAATLVDALLDRGYSTLTVLDISEAALSSARARLGERAARVRWIRADVTRAELPRAAFDFWHDRAVFHFLRD